MDRSPRRTAGSLRGATRRGDARPDPRAAREREDLSENLLRPGHITSSAWIVSRSRAALFTHHRKLGRWLQLGGTRRRDGRAGSALRGAEESGLRVRGAPRRGPRFSTSTSTDPRAQGRAGPRAPRHPLSGRGRRRAADRSAERESKEVRWFTPARSGADVRRGEHPADGQAADWAHGFRSAPLRRPRNLRLVVIESGTDSRRVDPRGYGVEMPSASREAVVL